MLYIRHVISIYICIYIYICHIYIYICHICTHVNECVYIYICTHVYVIYVYIYIYICYGPRNPCYGFACFHLLPPYEISPSLTPVAGSAPPLNPLGGGETEDGTI